MLNREVDVIKSRKSDKDMTNGFKEAWFDANVDDSLLQNNNPKVCPITCLQEYTKRYVLLCGKSSV